MKKIF
jgi:hypothetical protein